MNCFKSNTSATGNTDRVFTFIYNINNNKHNARLSIYSFQYMSTNNNLSYESEASAQFINTKFYITHMTIKYKKAKS